MNGALGMAVVAVAMAALQPRVSLAFEPPAIPVGAWYESARMDTDHVRTAARSLKEHHFNTVVANQAFTREVIDIFAMHGIAVITRGNKFLDHPAVIGSVVGEAPRPGKQPGTDVEQLKQQYRELCKRTDKPLITCVVGDGLGVANVADPWKFWNEVQPQVRCLRWYGIGRNHYGILHKRLYKGHVAFSSVLRIAKSGKSPYWIVLPSFGKNERDADYQNPRPAQIRGMMHLALAYGARGILFWALQDHGDWRCLVDGRSLKPTDGKYAAAAEVAAKINAHAALITSLNPRGGDVRCPSPFVEAVGQRDNDGKLYVYAVNKNTREAVSTCLLWWGERRALTNVRDVFSGQELKAAGLDEEGYWRVPLALAPGEGKLLDFDFGRDKPKRKPGGTRKGKPEDGLQHAVRVGTLDGEPGASPVWALLPGKPAIRKAGPTRARKLLGPWMDPEAKWEDPLFGGRLLIDGKSVYQGGGKLLAAHESKGAAVAAWDATAAFDLALPVKAVFVTSGIMQKPRPWAFLLLDVAPKDGKEHTYEVHLPVAGELDVVRTLACNITEKMVQNARRNSQVARKLYLRNYEYSRHYPTDRPNLCADTVLRHVAKNERGWLISRVIEPRGGPVFPAAYRRPEATGEAAGSLVVSGRGKALRLKMLLFVDNATARDEPRVFTVWTAKNELRLGADSFLRFGQLDSGRTVLAFSSPAFSVPVGANDDK